MGKTFRDKFKTYHAYSEPNVENIVERNKRFTQDSEDTFSRQTMAPKISREYSSRFIYKSSYNWKFIRRWIYSQVGKKWDDVYAMLVHHLPSPDDRKLLENSLRGFVVNATHHKWPDYNLYIDEENILRISPERIRNGYSYGRIWEAHVVKNGHWYAKNVYTNVWFEVIWDISSIDHFTVWCGFEDLMRCYYQDLKSKDIAPPPKDLIYAIKVPAYTRLKLRTLGSEELETLGLK